MDMLSRLASLWIHFDKVCEFTDNVASRSILYKFLKHPKDSLVAIHGVYPLPTYLRSFDVFPQRSELGSVDALQIRGH